MDIEQKLCILHLLDLNNTPLSKDSAHEIMISLGLFKPLEVELILSDLIKSELIKEEKNMLSLREEGLVVLQFFRDRLPLPLQEILYKALVKEHPSTQWQIYYDEQKQRLYLNYEKEEENLLSLDFFLEPQAYELIRNNLSRLEDKDFTELKMFFLNK